MISNDNSNLKDDNNSNSNSNTGNSRIFRSEKSLTKISMLDKRLEDIYTEVLERSMHDDNSRVVEGGEV